MITKNATANPTTIKRYIKGIKEVWNEQGTLRKTPKGQKLCKFVIRRAATWPLDFFLQDWDKNGYLQASKDTKAWWAVQKLTGFHCHCRTAVDDATARDNEKGDEEMEIEANSESSASAISKNKRKSQDKNSMDTDLVATTTSNKTAPANPTMAPYHYRQRLDNCKTIR
jgi:hypothetical protein